MPLGSLLAFVHRSERMVVPSEIIGAVSHEKRSKLSINAGIRPSFRNTDDARGVFPKEDAKIFDVFGKNNAALGDSKRIDLRIGKATEIKVMLDVLDVKAFIETGEILAG